MTIAPLAASSVSYQPKAQGNPHGSGDESSFSDMVNAFSDQKFTSSSFNKSNTRRHDSGSAHEMGSSSVSALTAAPLAQHANTVDVTPQMQPLLPLLNTAAPATSAPSGKNITELTTAARNGVALADGQESGSTQEVDRLLDGAALPTQDSAIAAVDHAITGSRLSLAAESDTGVTPSDESSGARSLGSAISSVRVRTFQAANRSPYAWRAPSLARQGGETEVSLSNGSGPSKGSRELSKGAEGLSVAPGVAAVASKGDIAAAIAEQGDSIASTSVTVDQLPDFIADEAAVLKQTATSEASGEKPKTGISAVKEIGIEISPGGLGSISVKIRLTDGKLSVVLEVESSTALSAVQDRYDAICERLGASDQTLESLTIRQSAPATTDAGDDEAAPQRDRNDAATQGNRGGAQQSPFQDRQKRLDF